MKRTLLVATIGALLMTLACVTVNVYFPAAEVQNAADRIVEEVRGTESPSSTDEPAGDQSMLERTIRELGLFEQQAYAQADIDVTTPNIRALKESMKDRFGDLEPLYDKGVIGETKDGMLEIRSSDELNLKEKAEAKKLVGAENSDRENLYREIAKANDLPSDTVGQIQELFANSWRKNAKKGWWIQQDDGKWIKKDLKE